MKIPFFIIIILALLLSISIIINVMVIRDSVKKTFKFSDIQQELKNRQMLEKKKNYFLTKLDNIKTDKDKAQFDNEYDNYLFQTFWKNAQSYDTMPIIINAFPDLSDDRAQIEYDFYVNDLLNQIFCKCNFIDLRR